MNTVRRVLLLAAVSISGIALLAPLAARSAIEAPVAPIDHLLPAMPARADIVDRGGLLTARSLSSTPFVSTGSESLTSAPLPTPASAPMQATLQPIATPRPAAPAAPAAPAPVVNYDGGTVWDQLAQCESGGNWAINTGNGYYGGLQFSYGTWLGYGGGEFAEYAHLATREQQIIVAERLHAARGFAPWPACSAKLGL
ncbi:MAG TPA: transglycosylase family protein [Candidatus Limnocylindrales bacterium]|nr:transglycosylase family protein [Candidatus Limnocylindrales bacterium]